MTHSSSIIDLLNYILFGTAYSSKDQFTDRHPLDTPTEHQYTAALNATPYLDPAVMICIQPN